MRREVVARYTGTAAGAVWLYAQPLATLAAYFLVFDVVLGMRLGPEAPTSRVGAFLVVGALPWMAWSDAIQRSMGSLLEAGALLQKNALPPVLFPVIVTEERTATRQALIDWRGNRYSVPPELAAAKVTVSQRLGADSIDIATLSGAVIARHRLAQPGLGITVRDTGHVTALEAIAMASAPPGRPHRRKERIPPGAAARQAAAVLTGTAAPSTTVISLAAYEQAAKNRNTLR